ncbi:DgyrCDS9957 [Dimorphilus gyrociliatus]|uniref:CDK-activating kinase assembly factor MAT1 n=1 Tax=Dimorphilus gyrociliatus TaxID=2664684 RepID=A0A7I8VZ02_9ANNE|nr:DgyrCDS9957 [Dimorphilus gyrociliatus]
MDDIQCPRCKTTKYRNPSLKLLVNVCGHPLCHTCVEFLFTRGSGPCPECGISLRKQKFRLQTFEDSYIEKEVDIRKRILKDFNKREEDFLTLAEYNDYLEEVENIVFNLTNEVDVEETNRKVEEYRRANQEIITRNRSKLSKDEEFLSRLIEDEKMQKENWNKFIQREEAENEEQKKKRKEALLEELTTSTLSADKIINAHKKEEKEVKRQTEFSTGISVGARLNVKAEVKIEYEQYSYIPIERDMCGPEVGEEEELLDLGYATRESLEMTKPSDKAGGYRPLYHLQRSLEDAFCGLFFHSIQDSAMDTGL